MRNRKAIDALSLGAIFISAGIIALSLWALPPKVDSQLYSEMGRVLARQALELLPPGGEISVIARDTTVYPQPAMEIALNEFRKEADRAGIKVTARLIQLDPLRPVEVPPGDFYEAIRRGKPNQVIVSLLGPPVLEPEQRNKLPQGRPKIVALCIGSLAEQSDLQGLFQEGLLHAAIVRKKAPNPPAESFEHLYTLLRPDGAADKKQ
jgi:hypothetical protein